MGQRRDRGFPRRVDPEQPAADWRDAAVYAPLLDADRSIFAWEWLRRDPGYRAAAKAAFDAAATGEDVQGPEPWGLLAFEAPELAAPDARPVWSTDAHPYVLEAESVPSTAAGEPFAIERLGEFLTIVHGRDGREHLLLSDGFRAIRVDIVAGRVTAGPAQLRYRLAGFASAEKPLLALRQLLAVHRTSRFSRSLHVREVRARRWLLHLRAYDALAAGADQRKIAAVLLSRTAGELRWRSRASSIRSQVQRLVRSARHMEAGAYRDLLW